MSQTELVTLDGVREHGEGYPVVLHRLNGRLVVTARNEGGYDATHVDLRDLMDWLAAHDELVTWLTVNSEMREVKL